MSMLLAEAAELIDRGMVTIPFPRKEIFVSQAMAAFDKLLCQQARPQFRDRDNAEIGYVRRDDNEHKTMFQYRPSLCELAREGEMDSLVEGCEEIHPTFVACEETMLALSKALDAVAPGFGLLSLACHPSSRARNLLRLIQYDRERPGREIAVWHTDVSFLTLHFYDSYEALHVRLNGAEYLYRSGPGTALVFPGNKVRRAFPRLRELEHAAIESPNPPPEERRVGVFFFNLNLALLP
jgi:hypothetical protein